MPSFQFNVRSLESFERRDSGVGDGRSWGFILDETALWSRSAPLERTERERMRYFSGGSPERVTIEHGRRTIEGSAAPRLLVRSQMHPTRKRIVGPVCSRTFWQWSSVSRTQIELLLDVGAVRLSDLGEPVLFFRSTCSLLLFMVSFPSTEAELLLVGCLEAFLMGVVGLSALGL